jgi:iron complex outermembrane recepter protein
MKWIIGLLVLQLYCSSTIANTYVHGVITDTEGEPLIGVNVLIDGTFAGAATNADGRFRISVKNGSYRLKVSHMGYETFFTDIDIQGETRVDVSLKRLSYLADEVIVSATRVHAKVPVAFTNVGREEIKNRDSGQDIPFIIGLTPSFVASSDAGSGIGYTGFRIRGSDMNRINITLNGIPLNDSESHGVWWVNMPDLASSLENIQIQRGVGTSSHGAGAFGASINLQTSTLNQDPYGEITSSAGSFNSFRNTVRVGSGMINNRFTLDARLSRITSDGYIERASSDLKSFFISGGMHNENSILKINVFSGQEKTYQAWYGVPSYMLDIDRRFNGVGRYTDENGETAYYDNETDNYQQDHYQLFYSREITSELSLNTAIHYTSGYGYYEQYKENHRLRNYGIQSFEIGDQVISRTDVIRRKILDNDFYGMTYSLNYNRKKYDFILGGAWNNYIGDHYGHIIWSGVSGHIPKNYQWYFNAGDKKDFNIFGKTDYRLTGRINLYADLQLRTINYTINGLDDDRRDISRSHDYRFFNPKGGVFFELDNRQNLYLSYAVAHREPSRSNFKDARPDEIPRPERLDNIETGYNFRTRAVSLNANLFYMKYRDQLVLTGDINDVGNAIMTNVARSYRTGIELLGGVKFSRQIELGLNISLSENRILDFTEYVDNWDYDKENPESGPLQFIRHLGNTDIAFSPPVVAGGDISWIPLENLRINLSGKYVDRQFIDNTASRERMLNPYFFSDLRLNYNLQTRWLGDLGINLLVGNIFDSNFVTNAWIYRYKYQGREEYLDGYFPQAGRHYFMGFSVRF